MRKLSFTSIGGHIIIIIENFFTFYIIFILIIFDIINDFSWITLLLNLIFSFMMKVKGANIKIKNILNFINKYSSPKLVKFNEKVVYFIFVTKEKTDNFVNL